ncbi:MAG: PepSY domain-containing protein [Phycisphaerales bacterium]|nr:MAG: PepSY domain-containing protein [Phycisphaerales bacterium]
MHKWVGIVSALLLINVSVTGLLLLEKKKFAWLQPPTQTGAPGTAADFITIQDLLAAVTQLKHPDFPDLASIDRIDFRPGKRVFKVRSVHHHSEIQVDATDGRILSVATRRSDLIESLHDGSRVGPWMHGTLMPLAAVANFLLVITGLYLWLKRSWPRRRRNAV